jgi:hypothetical protein
VLRAIPRHEGKMNCDVNEQPCAQGDLSARSIAYLLWGLPALLILAGVLWPQARLWVWTPALLTAAAACVVNAARCDRLHCYFTGPLFLLAAAGTFLRGLEIVAIPWSWIG